MNKLWVVTKNEFKRYFLSPLAYVYLISFLILNGSFAIYFGHFFERGRADLLPMFGYHPWLYLLFIPGISMRLWAEEFRTKTILQLVTQPLTVATLVWGKFFASWLFCALALILTFPFWLTVNLLGTPDNAVIALSYVGSLILAGCMLAISQTLSSLTKNQVIALVLSVIVNLLFFLCGIEYVLSFFRGLVPLSVIDMIASFSFITHFDTLIRGLIELRDLVFFISLILLFNFTTILIVSFKTAGTTQWLRSGHRLPYIVAFVCLLISFVGINLVANNTLRRFQADFTQDKLFTLTDSTVQVLQNLPEPVIAKLYYSPILGQRNPDVRLMFDNIRLLLKRYAAMSNGNFDYRIYNPEPFSDAEDQALNAGLQPLPIIDTNINAYLGLTFTDETEKQTVIPYFPLQRMNFIEQDLTTKLYLLNHVKPEVGIITSLPMFEEIRDNLTTPLWAIIEQLREFYDLKIIDDKYTGLQQFKAIIIAHPQKLSPQLELLIAEYTRKGGKILAFFDIASEASALTAPVHDVFKPSDFGSLPQLWGIKFHAENVIADMDNSTTIDATTNYRTNPLFTQDLIQFYLQGKNFNPDFKATKMLKKMMLTTAADITPLDNAPIYFFPLLQASDNSALLSSDVFYQNTPPAEILRNFHKDGKTKVIAARIISKNHSAPFELIAVGDSDLLYDNFWASHQTILERNYTIPLLDNANFVLNALDTLLGQTTLIDLRGKTDRPRPFVGVEKMRRAAQQRFKINEKDIFDDIDRTKRGLQEIWNKKNFEGREDFTADELAIIAGIRRQIEQRRHDLYNIRVNANRELARLDTIIKLADIYTVPLIVLLLILGFWAAQHRKTLQIKTALTEIWHNRRLGSLGLTALICLLFGIGAVYYEQNHSMAVYENQPVFSDLSSQINQISRIDLTTHDKHLRFFRTDGLWQLEGQPHFRVYQQRIRSFLSSLLEAVYYEKKSAKAENLALFGLTPLRQKGSLTTRIELKNTQGKIIQAFEVGKYDLDLGRGAKGAYLKFDNRFQVWLVKMDLIDLSLNPQEWTYSTVWNLRFGRLAQIDNQTDTDYIADVMKELLNAHLISAVDTLPSNAAETLKLNLVVEGDQQVELDFYQSAEHYYLRYNFIKIGNQGNLFDFSQTAAAVYYQISAADMEKITHAVTR